MSPVLRIAWFLLTAQPLFGAGAPDVSAWLGELSKARLTLGGREPDEASKLRDQIWIGMSGAHPVLTDWVVQDLGPDATDLIAGETSEAAIRRLLDKVNGDLARTGGIPAGFPIPTSSNAEDLLRTYAALAAERRRRRIDATIRHWGPFAITEGHGYRMSFIGYTEGLSDARNERFFEPGARLTLLEFDPASTFAKSRVLIDDPHGMMRDVDVSFDRKRLLFAWKKSDRLDDYHLYEQSLADGSCRQLTEGLGRADYEPIYLPDGDIVFTSTRPEQSVPCWWTEISNLYRMDGDGRYIRRLAIDQVHALYPQLMADGRVTYTRWDYNDRGQNFPHPVFSMNPDGQDQRAFYGGNSWFPTSLLHTRGIPGSHKAMAVAAGHHTWQQGKLVILDPSEGRDEGKGMHFIAPRREVPYERVDAAMQNGDLFRYPYPFSENEFLVSYRPDWGIRRFGLYWMNADGERELLHLDAVLDTARMVALGSRPDAAVIKDTVDYRRNTGTYYVKDVYQGVGLQGIPRGTARKIRVVRLDYRAAGIGQTHNNGEGGGSLNSSPVALGNGTWDVKQILGDVDVEADGSARFEVPAMESIYLQILDEKNRVIQTSRTWDTLRPGETKGCAGCHDKSNGNRHPYQPEDTLAWKHDAQTLQPFYGPARGFSFPKEIQPILDARCVSCHDGAKAGVMDLRGTPVDDASLNLRHWSRSYLNLLEAARTTDGGYRAVPETGLVSWINKMSRPTEIPPYFAGAEKSRLLAILEKGHYGADLSKEEYAKLAAWMDLLVPFSGDYWEGNAWNRDQQSYYRYYEGKREVGTAEQKQEITAYLARGPLPGNLPGFTRARYREVLGNTRLVAKDDGSLNPATSGEPVIIDRVRLATDSGGATIREFTVRILNGGTRELLAEAAIRPDGKSDWVILAKPVRSDVVAFESNDSATPPLIVESATGVSVGEVPVIGGYHPYLDLRKRK